MQNQFFRNHIYLVKEGAQIEAVYPSYNTLSQLFTLILI